MIRSRNALTNRQSLPSLETDDEDDLPSTKKPGDPGYFKEQQERLRRRNKQVPLRRRDYNYCPPEDEPIS